MSQLRRIVLAFALIAQLFAGGVPATHAGPDCGSPGDAGDAAAGAWPIAAPSTCGGWGASWDLDWYRVTVTETGSVLRADVTTAGTASVDIRDAAETRGATSGIGSKAVAYHVTPGDWYVRVWLLSGSESSYTLTLSTQADAASPDCGLPGDAVDGFGYRPWTLDGAAPIAPPAACSGTLDVGDPADIVTFGLDGTQLARLTLTFAGTITAYVYSADGHIDRVLTGSGSTRTAVLSDPGLARTWGVRVANSAAAGTLTTAAWTLTVALEPLPAANDCGLGRDVVGPSPAGGYEPLAAGGSCAGERTLGDTGDAFDAERPAAHGVARVVYTGPAGTRAFLETPYQREFAEPGQPAMLYLTGDEPSVSVIAYRNDNGAAGSYSLTYDLLPDTQDDCGAGHDAPLRRAWAVELLPVGMVCRGTYADGDRSDWYRILSEPGDFVELNVDSGRSSGFFGNEFHEEWEGGDSTEGRFGQFSTRTFSYWQHVDGPVSFGLNRFLATSYDLTLRIAPRATQDDCLSGHDADLVRGEPVVIELPGVACGAEFTTRADSRDDYVADLELGDLVLFSITPAASSAGPTVAVLDPSGDFRDDIPPLTRDGTSTFVVPVDEAGRWTFTVGSGFTPTPYQLNVGILRLP